MSDHAQEIAIAAAADQELRQRLAQACGILGNAGLGDMIWGHASLRSAQTPGLVLIKPHKVGMEEVGPDDIIGVDLSGERIVGTRPKHIETFIHTEIMRARSDVLSVVHVHAPSTVVFSALDVQLLPIGHEGALFQSSLPIFRETTDLINSQARGGAVARVLGDGDVLLLQNHGLVTASHTLEGAVLRAIFLEKACHAQLTAMAAGRIKFLSSNEDCASKRRSLLSDEQVFAAYGYLARKIEGISPACACAPQANNDQL